MVRSIEESFARGGGKGGQKVNKTSNCVVLRYPPMELTVRSSRERKRTLEHVARGQHTQLVAQLARASTAIEHRHDGVDAQPGVLLQSTQQAGQARAAAEAADVQGSQLHAGIVQDSGPRI